MAVNTNLTGRVRNTPLPKNRAMFPLFEAVINSLHSIEDVPGVGEDGFIRVRVIRDSQAELALPEQPKPGPDPAPEISGFEIVDNGVGFNDENFESFKILDTDYKAARGCRGVGRILWLVAFEGATVESVFKAPDGSMKRRKFEFLLPDGVVNDSCDHAPSNAPRKTTVTLHGFKSPFRETARKRLNTIANELLEHCLWYFIRDGGAPRIVVSDGGDEVDLADLYDVIMPAAAESDSFEIKGSPFGVLHVRLGANLSHPHEVTYCAANRPVKDEGLAGRIHGLSGQLQFDETPFRYSCFVTSKFLDENVRPERSEFNIPEECGALFPDTEISFGEIRSAVHERVELFLADQLAANRVRAKKRVEDYTSENPSYRPFLKYLQTGDLDIDPDISDKDLDLKMHKLQYRVESDLRKRGHELMEPKDEEGYEDYSARLQDYLDQLEDVKKSTLAKYVLHRKVVIDLLEKAIRLNRDGNYEREDAVHNLIMPMKRDSTEIAENRLNLWIVDERMAFHNFLTSDKPIKSYPITDNEEAKRPDICGLRVNEGPVLFSESVSMPFASLAVVEIKRPMRKDAGPGEQHDPVEQALGYLEKVRSGKLTTHDGRPISTANGVPGFCFVICDLTEEVVRRCKMIHQAKVTADGMGYFYYNGPLDAYVEICSFDRLVKGAKERNQAFFNKLGLPAK